MIGLDMFQEMDLWHRELDQAFKGMRKAHMNPSFLPGIGRGESPRINLSENEQAYIVEAVIPGIDPNKLDLNLLQGTLTLAGERTSEGDEGQTWHRHERGSGKFMRTIELPESIDRTKVEAEYRNGILRVRLPKQPSAQAKKIEIKAA